MKNEWHFYEGVWVKWHDQSPANRAAYCEATVCKGVTRRVERDAPRLQVDNKRGRSRVRSKGKKNQWVCQHCAADVPYKPIPDNQTELF